MSGSIDMQVLAVLRRAAADVLWLTPAEIGQQTNLTLKPDSVTSAIRRLRTQGFIINHIKRTGRTRQYSLRTVAQAH